MITLHTLRPNKGATKSSKRVGRGNSSGHGTYATRGLKGQKSRSGVSGLKRLGQKQALLAVPKRRGFVSRHGKFQVVNFDNLNKQFSDGDIIAPLGLRQKGLIAKLNLPVKILSRGELNLHSLKFKGVKFSVTARKAIEAKGGQVT